VRERLLVGRGGTAVAPAVGAAFDGHTMEAAEVTPTADAASDRTVAALLEPGLAVGPRSIRPARVAVAEPQPGAAPKSESAEADAPSDKDTDAPDKG